MATEGKKKVAQKKRIKEYLNSTEIFHLLKINKFIDEAEEVLENWSKRGNLTNEEHKYLKTCITWGLKFYDAILSRLELKTLENYKRRTEHTSMIIEDKTTIKQISERLNAKVDNLYKREEHFYNLAEITMDRCCKDCTGKWNECELAKLFIENTVPEPELDDDWEGKRCKFAYKLNEKKADAV